MRDATCEAHVRLSALVEAPVGGGLNASVLHVAEVLHIGGEARRRRDRHGDEGVARAAVVVVEAQVQAFPQPEVESHGEVARLLPFQVRVRHSHEVGARDIVVDDIVVELVGGFGLIGREVLVAGEAVGDAELAEVQPRGVAHEVFLVEVPARTRTPERTPAVVRAEHRRAVEAQAHVEEVALVVAVVGGACDAERTCAALGARGLAALGILLGEGDVVDVVVEESPSRHALAVAAGRLHRVGGVGQQQVLVPRVGVVAREVHAEAVGLAVGDGVAAALEVAVARPVVEACVVARIEIFAFVVLVGIAQASREAQVVDGAVFEVEVLDHLGVLREVLGAERGVVERVVVGRGAAVGARRGVGAQDFLHVAEGIRRGEIRIHGDVIGEAPVGAVVGVVAGDRERVAEHPLLVAVAQVDVALQRLAPRLLHHAGHIVVHQVGGIAHLLGASFDVSRVLVAHARAQGLRQPVGVDAASNVGRDGIVLLVEQCLIVG